MAWTNKKLWLVLQAGVTLALLVLLFESFDWHAFAAVYERISSSAYFASLAVVFLGQMAYAWRWHVVLRACGVAVRYRAVFAQYLIGMFVGNFLPSTVGGDVAKVYYLGRTHGYSAITASVILDRLLGFGIVAVMAAVVLVVEGPEAGILRLVRTGLLIVVAVTVVITAAAISGTGGLPRRVARFGARAVRWAEQLQKLRLLMLVALRHPAVLLHATVSVVGYFVALALVYRMLILLMCGLALGTVETLMVVSSTSVMSNLPISLNGLGVREQLHVVLFEPLGVPKEVAVATSLLLFSHTLLISAIGGILWMRAAGPSRQKVAPSV